MSVIRYLVVKLNLIVRIIHLVNTVLIMVGSDDCAAASNEKMAACCLSSDLCSVSGGFNA